MISRDGNFPKGNFGFEIIVLGYKWIWLLTLIYIEKYESFILIYYLYLR